MELKDYLRLVRAQWLTIVVCVVVATAGALVVTMRATPMYSASVKLIVNARAGTADASTAYQGNLLSQQLVKSYADLLTGRTMAQAVVADLKLREPAGQVVPSLHASAVPDTNLLVASLTDPSPRQAQRLANSLATQFTRRAAALQLPSAASRSSSGERPRRPSWSTVSWVPCLLVTVTVPSVFAVICRCRLPVMGPG